MTLQLAAPMRYFHERYLGRPCCPKCGELMIAPECQEFSASRGGDEIRNYWQCDGCDNRFATLVKFKSLAA